ncbi:MAG: PIN domain-containing protein, partial [Burkholderiales bacterium]|nr:PIN domain-containing protein [Opitutaceae bacterium]
KRARARDIIRGDLDWVVSWQIVQEFCAVALHRFKNPMPSADLGDYLNVVLLPRCRVMPTPELYRQALGVQTQTGYRFYDSLVVTSALVAGAGVLYSEDLQHGRTIGDLRIENPFSDLK